MKSNTKNELLKEISKLGSTKSVKVVGESHNEQDFDNNLLICLYIVFKHLLIGSLR